MPGMIPSTKDSRDYRASMIMDIAPDILPERFEVWIPPVANQGRTGNCVAQGCAGIKECWYKKHTGKHIDFSVGFVYGAKQTIGSGMMPSKAMQILQKTGNVFAADFESNSEVTAILTEVAEVMEQLEPLAAEHKIDKYYNLFGKDAIMSFIYKYGVPVLIGGDTDKITGNGSSGGGGHAVICYGWEDNGHTLLILNSWGGSWGDNGRGKCKYSAVEECWGWTETAAAPPSPPPSPDAPTVPTPEPPAPSVTLSDIEKHWAKFDILAGVADGVYAGYPDGTFMPERQQTRAESAVIWQRQKRYIENYIKQLLG